MRLFPYLCIVGLSAGALATSPLSLAQSLPQPEQSPELIAALCMEEWEEAMQILGKDMGNPQILNQQRMELFKLRRQIQDHVLYGSAIYQLPNCGVAIVAPSSNTASSSSTATEQSERQVAEPESAAESKIDWAAEANAIESGRRTVWNNSSISRPQSSPSYSGGYSGGSGGGGNCNYSWQKDSAGRSCGDRAADRRPGGR